MSEAFDKEVSPLISELAEVCKKHNISFSALFQYGSNPEDHCTAVLTTEEPESTKMFLVRAAAQCQGNVDALFLAIKERANKVGHSSIFLTLMDQMNKKD